MKYNLGKGNTRQRRPFENAAKNIHLLGNIIQVCQGENKKKNPFLSKTRQSLKEKYSSLLGNINLGNIIWENKKKISFLLKTKLRKNIHLFFGGKYNLGKQEKDFLPFENKVKENIFIFVRKYNLGKQKKESFPFENKVKEKIFIFSLFGNIIWENKKKISFLLKTYSSLLGNIIQEI